jgi:predicted phage-related endonuclease
MTNQVITQTTKTVVEQSTQIVELPLSIESAIARFNEAKAAIKALEEAKKQAEAEIRAALGEATIGTIAGVERVKVASRTRQDINKDDLKDAFPEAYELCLKETTYTVVTAVTKK